MRKLLVAAIVLSAGLTPLACILGLYTHPCSDCLELAACAHEELCRDDPCRTQALRPEPPPGNLPAAPALTGGHPLSTADPTLARAELLLKGRTLSEQLPDLHRCGRSLPLLI